MRRLAMLFWPAGILYAMQAIVTLLLVIFGRGDACGPHSGRARVVDRRRRFLTAPGARHSINEVVTTNRDHPEQMAA